MYFFIDGKFSWIEIPKLKNKCITLATCPKGITVSFWINYKEGDYIMAAGKYAGKFDHYLQNKGLVK